MRSTRLVFLGLLIATAVHGAPQFSPEVALDSSAPGPAAFGQFSLVTAASGDQVLAVWRDSRMCSDPHENADVLFSTRISSSGEVLDPLGVRLSPLHTYQQRVAWGGDAFLLVSANFATVYMQRIGTDGRPLHDPVVILEKGGEPLALASNGDGYLLVWKNDAATFGSWLDRDGRVTRTRELHSKLGFTSGLVVLRGVYYYFHVEFADPTYEMQTAYLTTLDAGGAVERRRIHDWQRTRFTLSMASTGEEIFVVESMGRGAFSSYTIREAGEPSRPTAFRGSYAPDYWPAVAWDGSAFLVYWSETGTSTRSLAGVRVARDGTPIDRLPLALMDSPYGFDAVVACSTNNCAAIWMDQTFSNDGSDIAGVMFRDFASLSANIPQKTLISRSGQPQETVRLASDGTSTLAVWREAGRSPAIRGTFLDRPPTFTIGTAKLDKITTVDVAYAAGVYLVAWREETYGREQRVVAVRVNGRGEVIDARPRVIGPAVDQGLYLAEDDLVLASDGTSFVIAWRSDWQTISVAHIDASLNIKPIEVPVEVAPAEFSPDAGTAGGPSAQLVPPDTSIHRWRPQVVFDGTQFVAAWSEARNHDRPFRHLRLLRIARDGALLSESIAEAPAEAVAARSGEIVALRTSYDYTTQSYCLTAAALGANPVTIQCNPMTEPLRGLTVQPFGDGYVAAWMQKRGTQYDLRGARFTLAGEVEPLVIAVTGEIERRPSLLRLPGGFLIGYDRVSAAEGWVPRATTRGLRFTRRPRD